MQKLNKEVQPQRIGLSVAAGCAQKCDKIVLNDFADRVVGWPAAECVAGPSPVPRPRVNLTPFHGVFALGNRRCCYNRTAMKLTNAALLLILSNQIAASPVLAQELVGVGKFDPAPGRLLLNADVRGFTHSGQATDFLCRVAAFSPESD